ncbi:MAG: ATP-binding protein [Planctomycetota bacterium]|jgi:CO dehydrogenase maturation factor
MKVAFSGKGGVGKTTVSAAVIRHLADRGARVFAVDADMDPNLPGALGFQEEIVPISEMKGLMEERMEVDRAAPGMYKLNPFVEDIPERFAIRDGNVTLVVMGGMDRGGGGCACPENSFLREIVTHIVISEDDWVILDMEAGVEHMGRATARAVDVMAIVAEPTPRAVQTAGKVRELAADIGVGRIGVVGNKIRGEEDLVYLRKAVAPLPLIGWIPHLDGVRDAERAGKAGFSEFVPKARVEEILEGLRGLAAAAAS